eukprot:PhF_6_TR33705/c1_g2_i1/m.49458
MELVVEQRPRSLSIGRSRENAESIQEVVTSMQNAARTATDKKTALALLEAADTLCSESSTQFPDSPRSRALCKELSVSTLRLLMETCSSLQDWDSAIRYCVRCLHELKNDSAEKLVPIQLQMCAMQSRLSQHESALKYAHAASHGMESLCKSHPTPTNYAYYVASRYNEATQLVHLGRTMEAKPLAFELTAISKANLPPTHPLVPKVQALVASLLEKRGMTGKEPTGHAVGGPTPPPTNPKKPTGKHSRKKHSATEEKRETEMKTTQVLYPALAKKAIAWRLETLASLDFKFRRRNAATLKIQCAWRCLKARLQLHNRKQIYLHAIYSFQTQQALKIQRTYALYLFRKTLKEKRLEVRRRQDDRAMREKKLRQAVRRVVFCWRKYVRKKMRLQWLAQEGSKDAKVLSDMNLLRWEGAVGRLIRWWRRVVMIRFHMRDYESKIKRLKQERQEKIETDAARIIQRCGVGMTARRFVQWKHHTKAQLECIRVASIPSAIKLIRTALQQSRLRHKRLVREASDRVHQRSSAAITIQRAWKKSLRHPQQYYKAAEHRRQLVRKAVLTLQRFYRRCRARRERRLKTVRKNVLTTHRIVAEWKRDRAITAMQRFVRRFILMPIAIRVRKAMKGRNVIATLWFVQRVCRGYLGRRTLRETQVRNCQQHNQRVREILERRSRGAVTLQRMWRGFMSRKLFAAMKKWKMEEKEYIRIQVRKALLQDQMAT